MRKEYAQICQDNARWSDATAHCGDRADYADADADVVFSFSIDSQTTMNSHRFFLTAEHS